MKSQGNKYFVTCEWWSVSLHSLETSYYTVAHCVWNKYLIQLRRKLTVSVSCATSKIYPKYLRTTVECRDADVPRLLWKLYSP